MQRWYTRIYSITNIDKLYKLHKLYKLYKKYFICSLYYRYENKKCLSCCIMYTRYYPFQEDTLVIIAVYI